MIGRLKGIVAALGEEGILLDVGGVGYEIFCNARTQSQLAVGEAAVMIIETHVREDHFHLYGFPSLLEREWFCKLCSVQRVGAKVALAIQNALTPDQLTQAILAKDTTAFSRISGIGPKLAERIVAELKDKVVMGGGWQVMGEEKKKTPITHHPSPTASLEDAISALVNLGYNRSEAYAAAAKAAQDAGADAGVDALIKRSLKALTRSKETA